MPQVIPWVVGAFKAVFVGGTAAGAAAGVAAATIVQAVAVGAIIGAVVGAVTAIVTGGNILEGALRGALIGGVSAGIGAWASGASWTAGGAEAGMGTTGVGEAGLGAANTMEEAAILQASGHTEALAAEAAAAGGGGGAMTANQMEEAALMRAGKAPPVTNVSKVDVPKVDLSGGGGVNLVDESGGGILQWVQDNPDAAGILGSGISQGAGAMLAAAENEDAMALAMKRDELNIEANKIRDLTELDLNFLIPTIDSISGRPEWSRNKEGGILGG